MHAKKRTEGSWKSKQKSACRGSWQPNGRHTPWSARENAVGRRGVLLLEVGGPHGPAAAAAAAAAGGWSSRVRDHQRRPHASRVVVVHLTGAGRVQESTRSAPSGALLAQVSKASTATARDLSINTSNTCHNSAHSGPVSPSAHTWQYTSQRPAACSCTSTSCTTVGISSAV